MQQELDSLLQQFRAEIAAASDETAIELVRTSYLGRKQGSLSAMLKQLKDLSADEKREWGPKLNAARQEVQTALDSALAALQGVGEAVEDLTLPGIAPSMGHLHPLTQIRSELLQIFGSMGFSVDEGQELDNDFYNFEALNFPIGHPARDMQDTFFVKTPISRADEHRQFERPEWVMRTQTSNMQVRIMEQQEPPLRAVAAGRVFRSEATDATHEHTFYQLEGFVVDKNVGVTQLAWTLREALRQLYGTDVDIRLRPGYFPFVEPGYEIDMKCLFCSGKGCSVCKQTGWVEMLGAGMIHPNVFEAAGYEPGKYTGFAFGMGYVRMAMFKYGISDMRAFMQNDIRLLEQF